MPGLINAHDHLQLNNLPRLPVDKAYRHAREWITDVNAHRKTDRAFEARVASPREDRLLIGGMKNLLERCHDRRASRRARTRSFRERRVSDTRGHALRLVAFLYIDGDERVLDSYRRTPAEWPWIIHAAEGVDEEARRRVRARWSAIGCIGPNTLIVHGLALDGAQRTRICGAGAGLVWCPSSNLRLFGKDRRRRRSHRARAAWRSAPTHA